MSRQALVSERWMPRYGLFICCMSGVSASLRAGSPSVPKLISLDAPWGVLTVTRAVARTSEGISVHHSRFVFLVAPMPNHGTGDGTAEGVLWMLVSSNNRPLGRGATYHPTYGACRDAVQALQAACDRLKPVETTMETTGQWTWRLELDDEPVAVSSRSYLRARECMYNLERFMEALPAAAVVAGVRRGRRRGAAPVSTRRGRAELRDAG
jgi:hypothetical protein